MYHVGIARSALFAFRLVVSCCHVTYSLQFRLGRWSCGVVALQLLPRGARVRVCMCMCACVCARVCVLFN